jgi:mevalonate kinase
VQGRGSGADVAASVFGGLIEYRAQPLQVTPFIGDYPLTAWYSGFKTKTADAILQMEQRFKQTPKLYQHLYMTISQCVQDGVAAVRQHRWEELGKLMNVQQSLLDAMGVNLPILQTMVDTMRDQQTILGSKISGSGLGDCVIGLGDAIMVDHLLTRYPNIVAIPVAMTSQGVCYD